MRILRPGLRVPAPGQPEPEWRHRAASDRRLDRGRTGGATVTARAAPGGTADSVTRAVPGCGCCPAAFGAIQSGSTVAAVAGQSQLPARDPQPGRSWV